MADKGMENEAAIYPAALGDLSRHWRWLLALGLLQIILGTVGLGMSVALTLASVLVYGIFLLIGGGGQIVQAFTARAWKGFFLHLLIAVLYVLAGIVIIYDPVLASLFLTLLLGWVLVAVGIMRIFMAFGFKGAGSWFWPLLAGVISIVLGFMIINHWPQSGFWIIGLFVAIELIINGWSYIFIALAARRAAPAP